MDRYRMEKFSEIFGTCLMDQALKKDIKVNKQPHRRCYIYFSQRVADKKIHKSYSKCKSINFKKFIITSFALYYLGETRG